MPMSVNVVGGTVVQQVTLNIGNVYASPEPLKVNIDTFKYDIGGVQGIYAGVLGQSVTDDDTSYVYLDKTGALVVNTTGWPSGVFYISLARVVAYSGEIVAIHDERILIATSPSVVGTCRISYPVDGDIRGGQTAASSNNDFGAIKYNGTPDTDTGRNRWNRRPPQNHTSGDMVLRVWYSWANAPANNDTIILEWRWAFRSSAEALGTWDGTTGQQSFEVDTEIVDTLYYKDLTMDEADFDVDADLMLMMFLRRTDFAGDDCDENMYVHQVELRYTGRLVAGQPGQ